jgi:hypothetical protein
LSIRFGSSVVFAGIALLGCGLRFAAALLRLIVVFGWNGRSVSESVGGLSMDTELQKHYALLLGIGSPWEVKTVELKLQEKKVEIELGWHGLAMGVCGQMPGVRR